MIICAALINMNDINKRYLWLIKFGSGNQADSLHQQIVVKVLVNVEQKVQTDFAKRKGKNQSCNVKHKVFVLCFFFLFDLNIVEGQKVRSRMVIAELYLRVG